MLRPPPGAMGNNPGQETHGHAELHPPLFKDVEHHSSCTRARLNARLQEWSEENTGKSLRTSVNCTGTLGHSQLQ